jgi:hypothetical protein
MAMLESPGDRPLVSRLRLSARFTDTHNLSERLAYGLHARIVSVVE